jgi:hypothetical protein
VTGILMSLSLLIAYIFFCFQGTRTDETAFSAWYYVTYGAMLFVR